MHGRRAANRDDNRQDHGCNQTVPPVSKCACDQDDGHENKTQLEQYKRQDRGNPSPGAALPHAAHCFHETECRRNLRPDACGIKDDRWAEGDQRKKSTRRCIVDSFVFEQAHRRAREKHAEECNRCQRAGQTAGEIAGNHQERQERLMSRIPLPVRSDWIAELRHEINTPRCRMREIAVLIGKIEIAIVNDRLGEEEIIRLVAVDRRAHHQRDNYDVEDRRDGCGAVRAPANVRRSVEGNECPQRGDDSDAEQDEPQSRIYVDLQRPRDRRQEPEQQPCACIEREPSPQAPAAKQNEW